MDPCRLRSFATCWLLIASLALPALAQEEATAPADPALAKVAAATNAEELNRALAGVFQKIAPNIRADVDAAEAQLEELKEVLSSSTLSDEDSKKLLQRAQLFIKQLESQVASTKKLTELIGKPAAPLKPEVWVNGTPLTETDLKGKVILLDFWAVWCGPCIATFPHLREWEEKYGEHGLEIIGVTRYYNFGWDQEAGRAKRQTKPVSPEDEQEMLVKFAEHHELKHRFAVMSDRSLSEYYGVTGIPHAVVIDEDGIIRMMKVGSGPQNAKDIGELLQDLLGEKAS